MDSGTRDGRPPADEPAEGDEAGATMTSHDTGAEIASPTPPPPASEPEFDEPRAGNVQLRARGAREVPDQRSPLMTFGAAILLLIATSALYTLTLTPSFGGGADAVRQLDAIDLRLGGGASDHPLFVAVAHGVSQSGLSADRARLVSWAAAACGTLAVLVVFLCGLRILDHGRLASTRSRVLFAAAGAASLAVAHGFWLRSVSPSPATLGSLLFALIVWLWVRRLTGGGAANMLAAAFLLGLAPALWWSA